MNDSHPWWLWPNLLALDAPAVAVTWQVFLGTVAGIAVPLAASVELALVVWAAYLIDRSLDARRGITFSDRHRVAGQNWRAWLIVAGAAIVAAAVVAFTALSREHLRVGVIVLGAAVGYFAAVHLLRAKSVLDRGAKEISVGVVFAAGVSIPLIVQASRTDWLPGVLAFAALCWLNCALISLWETRGLGAPPGWIVALAGIAALIPALAAPRPVVTAVGSSAVALLALHAVHSRVSVRAARVLADVALLSPLLVAICA